MTNHSALWDKLAELSRIHGAADARLPRWSVQAGPWKLTANATAEPAPYTGRDGITRPIPPRAVWVEYRRAPAGTITAERAEIAGGGRNATAYALLCALRQHIHRHGRPRP